MSLTGKAITILGAGIAGLALARALALRGARVTVLEQADALREVGAGLQISPNAAAVLTGLGLMDQVAGLGTRAGAICLTDGLTGDAVLNIPLDRAKGSYHFVHRADLIGILAKGARDAGVEMRLLQEVTSVDLAGDCAELTTRHGARHPCDILIGADGIHSQVRAALNGAGTPFFTGQIAWRAMIPGDTGDPDLAEVHMGPGRHLVSYPLRGGKLRNLVAVEERRAWVEEGWSLRDDPMEMRLAFRDFSPRVRGWLDSVEDVWLWGLFRHPVAETWVKTLPRGGVAILGDAAHPTLPFLAQGAAMGLEDAWVLADLLDRLKMPEALATYQARRRARCVRIVAAANGNARAYHLSGPMRSIAHLGLRLGGRMFPDAPLKRYDWLYRHDVTKG
jgi:salicylate hydroxylase